MQVFYAVFAFKSITFEDLICAICFIRDPNLWLVKCRIGEERQTAIQLMRKFIAYQFSDEVIFKMGEEGVGFEII